MSTNSCHHSMKIPEDSCTTTCHIVCKFKNTPFPGRDLGSNFGVKKCIFLKYPNKKLGIM